MASPSSPAAASVSPLPQPPKTTLFRFKRKRSTSRSATHRDPSPRSSHRNFHRHHHHRRHQRRSRHHPPTPPPDPSPFTKDPDTAFRESLFDAMADDEGAAFWEGVYGQPIHNYSPYYKSTSTNDESSDPLNPGAENVHKMMEDEYVAYVRGKMWEKSHEYVFEERARREEMRKRGRRKVSAEEDDDGREWKRGVEEALKRGEERRRRNKWKGVWEGYVRGWEGVKFGDMDEAGGKGKKAGGRRLRERIPWPVESGKWEDVEKEGLETFFGKAPTAATTAAGGGEDGLDLGEVLKKERVKWHPDKMQQRAGEGGIDAETLKLVTAVFQVVDRMWGEVKRKKG